LQQLQLSWEIKSRWQKQRLKGGETAWGTRDKADRTLGVAAAALRLMTAEPNPGAEAMEAKMKAGEAIEASQEARQEDTSRNISTLCKYLVFSSKNIYRLCIAVD
jgi:hypothetical protein